MDYTEEAKLALAEYVLKGKILTIEKKHSSIVAKVTYTDNTLKINTRTNKDFTYNFKDTKENIIKMFNKFVKNYNKIKNGGQAERDKYSLGKYFNDLVNIYPKEK